MPQIIADKLPDIVKYLADLCMKSSKERLSLLTENKKSIQEGINDNNSSDEETEAFDKNSREFKEVQTKLKQMNEEKKLEDGQESDTDYEYEGQDDELYYSAL